MTDLRVNDGLYKSTCKSVDDCSLQKLKTLQIKFDGGGGVLKLKTPIEAGHVKMCAHLIWIILGPWWEKKAIIAINHHLDPW